MERTKNKRNNFKLAITKLFVFMLIGTVAGVNIAYPKTVLAKCIEKIEESDTGPVTKDIRAVNLVADNTNLVTMTSMEQIIGMDKMPQLLNNLQREGSIDNEEDVFRELTAEPIEEEVTISGTVTGQGVNLRAIPGLDGRIKDCLPKNTKVEVIDKKGEWYKVKIVKKGKVGYIFEKYISIGSFTDDEMEPNNIMKDDENKGESRKKENNQIQKQEETKEFEGVKLQYSAKYDITSNPLNRRMGVKNYKGHRETYYSQKVLPGRGLKIPGRHVANDGTIRDKEGYISVAADRRYKKQGETLMTSLGPAKVYDTGCANGTIDIYVNW